MRFRLPLSLVLALALIALPLAPPASAQRNKKNRPGALVTSVLDQLEKRFRPKWFADPATEKAIDRARRLGPEAKTIADERALVFGVLETIQVSHLGLLSNYGHEILDAELRAKKKLTVGFQLVRLPDGFFVDDVLEDGPGARAGMRRGDRVSQIDDLSPEASPRLDYRTDDAALDDSPRHFVRVTDDTGVSFAVERRPGETLALEVTPTEDSAAAADRRAAATFEADGRVFGYVPLRFMYYDEATAIVEEALDGPLAKADGMILDLRGRGGSGDAAAKLASWFRGKNARWKKPLVCLIDGHTRSAKEILAHDLKGGANIRLVGEKTAGAVRPCTFIPVGRGTYLMTPLGSGIDPAYTEEIELKGVTPDVACADRFRFSAGEDPILTKGLEIIRAMATPR